MANALTALLDRTPLTAAGRFRREVAQEKAALDRAAAGTTATPAPPRLVALDDDKAIWKIATAAGPRFMSVSSKSNDADRFIVEVSGDKLYRAWLNRPAQSADRGRSDHCLLRNAMASDYKFEGAANGFKPGRENPVPLAECYCETGKDGSPYVRFNNGVTRTFWLLANRAESFPVEARGSASARELHRAAGIRPGPLAVADLFVAARRQGVPATVKPERAPPAPRAAPVEQRVLGKPDEGRCR